MNNREYNNAVKKLIINQMSDEHLDDYISTIRSEKVIGTLPHRLYRYRPFNEYTLSEIINQHIFLSPVDNLDDKLDSKYIYDPFMAPLGVEVGAIIPRLPAATRKKIKDANEYFAEHMRIACLTQSLKNMPMWNYYAQGHKGICIEYSMKDYKAKDVLLPVIYPSGGDTYKFLPKKNQMKCGALFNSIVKDESWGFEKEWRLMRYVDDKEMHYVDWKMRAIYFGCDTLPAAKEVIMNIIEKNNLKINLMQMKLGIKGLIFTKVKD